MDVQDIAERVRDTCLKFIIQAYDDAGIQGLCAEGRWEAAVGALRALDLAPLVKELKSTSAHSRRR